MRGDLAIRRMVSACSLSRESRGRERWALSDVGTVRQSLLSIGATQGERGTKGEVELTQEVKAMWLGTCSRLHQRVDKTSKALQWMCNSREGRAPVSFLETDDRPIENTFAIYYPQLYGADLPMSCLTPEDREALEADVSCDELRAVLAHIQAVKAPCPNGLPTEFWCLVWPQTSQLLLETF
ncbi:hypothetical protein NDU88_003934 [Pleurodeles waltl]|uniref:Uncharacterized protein n=1 Tax=Pleurodeles waltl TaxID=8319 RepID=A0AAV7MX15_PLEWA|nr:hypothetical protein NDU88_003934 [Pleurodeles waltl]